MPLEPFFIDGCNALWTLDIGFLASIRSASSVFFHLISLLESVAPITGPVPNPRQSLNFLSSSLVLSPLP